MTNQTRQLFEPKFCHFGNRKLPNKFVESTCGFNLDGLYLASFTALHGLLLSVKHTQIGTKWKSA